MTMWTFLDAILVAAGYVASIYSWPIIKVWVNGASAEIVSIRAKAVALEAKIKAL
jgi:hypothetical protein